MPRADGQQPGILALRAGIGLQADGRIAGDGAEPVTQLLVETLTIVIFLLALRVMPRRFAPTSQWVPRWARVMVALAIGVVVPCFAMLVRESREAPSVAEDYFARSVDEAGGANVVNVILVDFRGFDTMGEITVLAVAALGVVNLVRVAERQRRAKSTGSAK